jgi:hypothetical protein
MSEIQNIIKIKNKYKESLFKKKGVIGVGVGRKETNGIETDQICVRVYVRKKIDLEELHPTDIVPQFLGNDNVCTDVIEVEEFVALDIDRTQKHRPVKGGISIGHKDITAGTYGTQVTCELTNRKGVLSNAHVLADINDGVKGDTCYSPGPYDISENGLVASECILGELERSIEIPFNTDPGCDLSRGVAKFLNWISKGLGRKSRFEVVTRELAIVDCALMFPLDDNDISDDIIDIGPVSGMMVPELDMEVKKSGRTTGTTEGKITDIDATVSVSYGAAGVATFEHQVICNVGSAGGDSGSLIVDKNYSKAVALLFAGGSGMTIGNKIQDVALLLKIRI